MKNPPLSFLQAAASLLALIGMVAVIGFLFIYQLPTASGGGGAGSNPGQAEANLAPAYDEQKAIAAGLEPNLEGKQLFENNCKQCHAIDQVVVGPALGNVTNRRSTEWLHSFIRNSSQVIQSGDPVAKELFVKYDRIQMPPFQLSDQEIDAILSHIKFETAAYGM